MSSQLETTEAERPVWLVKVPKFLAAKWKETAESGGPGAKLGTIRFQSAQLQPSETAVPENFTLSLPEGTEGVPLAYQISQLGDGQEHTHVFSSDPDEGLSVSGKVVCRFDAHAQRSMTENNPWETNWGSVTIDPAYCKLSRERYEAANRKTRTLQMTDGRRDRFAHLKRQQKPKRPAETLRGSRPSETKRVRMEKDELEKLLFSLFEKRPNWSLSDLVEATDQPQAWLKEILLQVAVLNKKGNVKGSYALKPEYAVNLPG
uniref:Transcription initiation factor TFIIF subunit beta n=1 Tax=Tetraselmis sp. GSL018 TaxID=582737 RepID=A0A061S5P8_9CHLO